MQVELNGQELEVVINALNYASGEWATFDDEQLSDFSDCAEALEALLKTETAVEVGG